ncbi:hypothetical protein BGZ61DRAFT_515703 [Ilyonectria robusta]|uniref:uncharacterized protein n=1 Tax=Ilyonectria robusta TaxID=1079257 RepID=UPI001E8D1350|nr:uncharacterized protein BGZ61DRAFT_515703 [Ilyonectria robusta]KAH8729694.1 hypothetical protein BGZ61DRAFT_515703 [Ilyonectria robusta]
MWHVGVFAVYTGQLRKIFSIAGMAHPCTKLTAVCWHSNSSFDVFSCAGIFKRHRTSPTAPLWYASRGIFGFLAITALGNLLGCCLAKDSTAFPGSHMPVKVDGLSISGPPPSTAQDAESFRCQSFTVETTLRQVHLSNMDMHGHPLWNMQIICVLFRRESLPQTAKTDVIVRAKNPCPVIFGSELQLDRAEIARALPSASAVARPWSIQISRFATPRSIPNALAPLLAATDIMLTMPHRLGYILGEEYKARRPQLVAPNEQPWSITKLEPLVEFMPPIENRYQETRRTMQTWLS